MFLNNFSFIIFFIVSYLLLLVFQAGRKYNDCLFKRVQIILLLLLSYVFISVFNLKFGLCVLSETLIAYFSGKLLNTSKYKKMILSVSVIILCCFLGYFKYTDFFAESFSKLLGFDYVTLNIILPIGISFYTFTLIGYVADIYKEKYKAETDFVNFALFAAFFPKIISGPIVRGNDFLPQIQNYIGLNKYNFQTGIQLFAIGLFKKIVLADRLGVFADDVFFAPCAYDNFSVIWGVLSYSLQIYFDFSGYSDMAIGISKILGFEISLNFNLPYIAANISDFWKRWHISLSSWLRDYIYIPLGGSRKGTARTYINLILVMLISGFWHGAGVTFILWGLFHGIASALNKLLYKEPKSEFVKIAEIIFTFIMVSLFWVVFRAETLSNAIEVYKNIFVPHSGIIKCYTWTVFALIMLFAEIIMALIKNKDKKTVYYHIFDFKGVMSYTLFFTFIGLILILGYFGDTSFIYGKF